MNFAIKVERPRDVDVTLTATMSVARWQDVQRDLTGTSPASVQLSLAIHSLVHRMSTVLGDDGQPADEPSGENPG